MPNIHTTPDLQNLVGLIRIRATSESAATVLSAALEDWMRKTGWEKHLKIAVTHDLENEVAFVPGAHQSNPEVRLVFRETPGFDKVRYRLEHWLYELI